jgi:hypothetical protein
MNPTDDNGPANPPAFDDAVAGPTLDPSGFDMGVHANTVMGINITGILVAVAALLVVVGVAYAVHIIHTRKELARGKKFATYGAGTAGVILALVICATFPNSYSETTPEGFTEWASATYGVDISDSGATDLLNGEAIAVERDGFRYVITAGTDSDGLTYLFNGSGTEFMLAGDANGGSPAIDPGTPRVSKPGETQD